MRIGFDAKRLFNNFTGLGNHSRTTIDILNAEYPDSAFYLYTPHIAACPATEGYRALPSCHVRQPHGFPSGSLWRTFGLADAARRDGVDIFHGLSNELPTGLHRKGIPSVVTIHDVAFRTFTDMYHRHDRIIYDMKWRHACHAADRIICISQCTKQDVMRFYDVDSERISVVYQPVNSIYYEASEQSTSPNLQSPTTPYMLYVGSVNSRKNLMLVVQAMTVIPEDLRLPLVVVGNGGEYKRRVCEYISSHGLENLVTWMSVIDHRHLRELYANATLFLYPSFYEGFGLPVVEASLCGCPVITSNVSSLPEAGGPAAIKVDPNSVDDMVQAMTRLITDDELRHRFGAEARRYAMQTFHPTTLAHRLMQVYEETRKLKGS